MRMLLFILLQTLTVLATAAPRTAFVQMFEWPWKDIAWECEAYLGPAGFSAVQISPPHEHIIWKNNPWWERYQVVSYKIHSRSGNEAEFKDMINRCKRAGVDIYADVIVNHMTGIPGGTGIAGTKFSHYDYPGLYSRNDFHRCNRNGNDDIKNYFDLFELQNCELLDLADLATGSEYVRSQLAQYMNRLLDMGVAGFRIDAAKHVPVGDLGAIFARLKKPAYIYSEVIVAPNGPINYNDYLPVGDVTAYDYGYRVADAFRQRKAGQLAVAADGFIPSDHAIVFMVNHDSERIPTTLTYNGPDQILYRLAQVFMLAWPYGYPQVYSGFKFDNHEAGPPLDRNLNTLSIFDGQGRCRAPWTCEHRLPEVAAMVNFRNQTNKAFTVNHWWTNNSDALAFSRGQAGFVAINYSNRTLSHEFSTTMPDGFYCNILDPAYNKSGRCNQGFQVRQGKIGLNIPTNSAIVLLQNTQVSGKPQNRRQLK